MGNINTGDIFYFNTYDTLDLSESERNNDFKKHCKEFELLKDSILLNDHNIHWSNLTRLEDHGFNFWVKVLNDSPYYGKDNILVDLTFMYVNRGLSFYVDKASFTDKVIPLATSKTDAD